MAEQPVTLLRIGELSRRVGVSEHVLRAWERRYGLPVPVRSEGGYRLYSPADEARIRRMQTHIANGLSSAQAAQAALAEEPSTSPADTIGDWPNFGPGGAAKVLTLALDSFDEPTAQAAIDRLLSDYTVETVLRDVLLPYLRQLGDRWASGEISVAHEHFASNLLRGRLTNLARGWGKGNGPTAVLACAPGEQHDLPLLMLGITLSRLGWRIVYLGVDTPLEVLSQVAIQGRPDLIVVALTDPQRLHRHVTHLTQLADTLPLAIAGAGATSSLAEKTGAQLITTDPVAAAEHLHGARGQDGSAGATTSS
jgi:MerR family transcriptional regulator, light-induced transcriptional regulator